MEFIHKKKKDALNKPIICQICIIYSFLVAVVGGFFCKFPSVEIYSSTSSAGETFNSNCKKQVTLLKHVDPN